MTLPADVKRLVDNGDLTRAMEAAQDGTLAEPTDHAQNSDAYLTVSGYSGYVATSNGTRSVWTPASSLIGTSGYSGYSGASGISGYSGAVGESGYSGADGVSGASGFSGFSGYSGLNGSPSGYSGTFLDQTGKTVTVVDGLVISVA